VVNQLHREGFGPQVKSRRFTMFDQLYSRYAIEPRPAIDSPEPGISPVIVPTIEVNDLYPLENLEDTEDISGTAGVFVEFFSVPSQERWHLLQVDMPATTANSSGRLNNPDATPTVLKANNTNALILFQEIKEWRLDAGWLLGMTGTGNAGDNSRIMRILFYRERLN